MRSQTEHFTDSQILGSTQSAAAGQIARARCSHFVPAVGKIGPSVLSCRRLWGTTCLNSIGCVVSVRLWIGVDKLRHTGRSFWARILCGEGDRRKSARHEVEVGAHVRNARHAVLAHFGDDFCGVRVLFAHAVCGVVVRYGRDDRRVGGRGADATCRRGRVCRVGRCRCRQGQTTAFITCLLAPRACWQDRPLLR